MAGITVRGVDGPGMVRSASPGDTLIAGKVILALTTAGAGTLTGALLTSGVLRRTGPTAGFTDTTDTSTNILNALSGGFGNVANVVPGSSFDFTYINGVAFAMTMAAGLGVILGTNTGVAASAVRDYLITVLSAKPQALVGFDTTNASPTLTFVTSPLTPQQQLDALGLLEVGMTVSGSGIVAGTTIAGINYSARTVTLSANANATGLNTPLSFLPTVRIDGIRSATA